MSDCGVEITFRSKDGVQPTKDEQKEVKRWIEKQVKLLDLQSSMAEPFDVKIAEHAKERYGNDPGFSVVLTRYWLEDGVEEDEMNELLDMDREEASKLLKACEKKFEARFRIELYSGHW